MAQRNFSRLDLDSMETRFRAKFINGLSGFKPANLVGTKDELAVANLAIISSVFHVGSNPPLLGMLIRPHSVPRDTLANIKSNGAYTINHVSADFVAAAHQTSARYAPDINEFAAVGLTEQYTDASVAPYVAEAPIKLALRAKSVQTIELNQTELVIGEVIEAIIDEDWIGADGFVDLELAGSLAISSLDSYHQTQRIQHFRYAKPDITPTELNGNDDVSGKP